MKTTPLVGLLLLAATCGFAQRRPATVTVTFSNPPGVAAPQGYSHAASIDLGPATMLIISGQVALDAQGGVVGRGNVGQQAEQAFANTRRIVEAAGGSMRDVVKLSYFMLDLSQIQAVRDVRDRYVNTAAPPASTAVQVSKLFRDELLIEIEATAVIAKK